MNLQSNRSRLPAMMAFFLLLTASVPSFLCADAPKAPDVKLPAIAAPPVKLSTFSFKLPAPALTSAGVYDAQDHLVQVLWTMKPLPGGKQTGTWDGKDQFGQAVPPGKYHYEVLVSHAVYTNVGAIGNSGKPSRLATHTPPNIQSVTTDAEGGIYTANGWDEGGADFKKWNSSGVSLYDAQFQIRNGHPNGAPYRVATDDKYLYCAMGGWADPNNKHQQQIQRFKLADGKAEGFPKGNAADGHIQIYEWPEKLVPAGTPAADVPWMTDPLRALVATSDSLYVTDALGGRVLCYDKVTGEKKSEFPVPLPQALAIDAAGRLWVGGQHHNVTIFSTDGKQIAQPITDAGEIEEMAFGPDGKLYVADSIADQVKVYDVSGSSVTLNHTLGHKAKPGDRAADSYYHLNGVSVDPAGNVVTTQQEPQGGARLAKWASAGKLLWEQFGAEFVSLGNYSTLHPDDFYSMTFHRYKLVSHQSGTWEYAGAQLDSAKPYKSDQHGVPRVLRLSAHDFYFLPSGDGVQIFRLESSGLMHLAALVGGGDPNPEGISVNDRGEWTWHDLSGTGRPLSADIQWTVKPAPGKTNFVCFGMDVDMKGNIWFANQLTNSIWMIPMTGLDVRGNPLYDWAKAHEMIAPDKSALEFRPTMAQHASDGTTYAYGWSKPWPSPNNNPLWMGGGVLARYDQMGRMLWAVPLPAVCVGLDFIPGVIGKDGNAGPSGGCIAGVGTTEALCHYSPDGLLLASATPGAAMGQVGWMDNQASVAVNRDPRDGILDIFTEDNFVDRIGWFRIDDHDIHTILGSVALPH